MAEEKRTTKTWWAAGRLQMMTTMKLSKKDYQPVLGCQSVSTNECDQYKSQKI